MSQPECPFVKTNIESRLPKTLQEYMKKYLILRPRLDPRYFVFDCENQLDYEDKNSDIVLPQYAEDSNLLPSPNSPPPNPQRTFCSEILREAKRMRLNASDESPINHSEHSNMPQQPSITEQTLEEKDTSDTDSESEGEELFLDKAKTPKEPCSPIDKSDSTYSSSISDSESPSQNSFKYLAIQTNQVKSLSKTRIATNSVCQKPPPHTHQWSVREMECLVSAVMKYGTRWKVIHNRALDIHPKRTIGGLQHKFSLMTRNGDFKKYLQKIKEKAGHKFVTKSDERDDSLTESDEMITSPGRSSTPVRNRKSPRVQTPKSPTAKTPVYKTPPMKTWTWTQHEMEWLVVGVNRYGNRWKTIHDAFNFHPSRSLRALSDKFKLMNRNGDFEKCLKNFRRKAGYKDLTNDSEDSEDPEDPEDTPPQDDLRLDRSKSAQKSVNKKESVDLWKRWKKSEIRNLKSGVQKYGPRWSVIQKKYTFKRTAESLKSYYYKFNRIETAENN